MPKLAFVLRWTLVGTTVIGCLCLFFGWLVTIADIFIMIEPNLLGIKIMILGGVLMSPLFLLLAYTSPEQEPSEHER